MAQVTVKEVPPVLPAKEYILTLNEEEADALVTLSGFVGGDPDASPRRHLEGVFKAMRTATGKGWMSTEAYALIHKPEHENRVIFDNYDHRE